MAEGERKEEKGGSRKEEGVEKRRERGRENERWERKGEGSITAGVKPSITILLDRTGQR